MRKSCLQPTAPDSYWDLLFYAGMISLLFLFISSSVYSQKAVPELWGQRIHDEAKVLSQNTIDQLEVQLKKYEDSTTNQIAVLIIPSLSGDVLEDYSIRVVEKWKLGTKKNDNGALLLIVIDDHKMRIEVGHGLEGVLTDAQSSRIIRNEMAPNFRRGDYDAGVTAAIQAMMKAIAGEYKANDTGTGTTAELSVKERIFHRIVCLWHPGGLHLYGTVLQRLCRVGFICLSHSVLCHLSLIYTRGHRGRWIIRALPYRDAHRKIDSRKECLGPGENDEVAIHSQRYRQRLVDGLGLGK